MWHWWIRGLGGLLRMAESWQASGNQPTPADVSDIDTALRILRDIRRRVDVPHTPVTSGRPGYL